MHNALIMPTIWSTYALRHSKTVLDTMIVTISASSTLTSSLVSGGSIITYAFYTVGGFSLSSIPSMPSKSSEFNLWMRIGIKYGMLTVRSSHRVKNSLMIKHDNSLIFSCLSDSLLNSYFYSIGRSSWYTLFGAFFLASTKTSYSLIRANFLF